MRAMTAHKREGGFTLIELMITVVIVVILMMVAVPSMVDYRRNAELTSASGTLLASINGARGEAMKRGVYAMVTPADGTNWSSGWLVFADKDLSKVYNSSTDIIVSTQAAFSSAITVTQSSAPSPPYILFNASGFSRTKAGGTTPVSMSIARNDVTGTAVYAQTRLIKIAQTGRARSCKPASASDANCSASIDD
jgi:type IV fimbrial biogenesis protein FimT